ncbi:MAG: ferritin-like domain-containing protein [Rubricoccaceae bacterium]|nr:ferritin-like domain-containing protein [Rubricoccaceae bacterium]
MALSNLNDLFVHTLHDIYYAEQQIEKALPGMASKAYSKPLRQAFEDHLAETRNQIKRLEQVFELVGEEASGERCPAIEGILKEARELLDEMDDRHARDAGMIAAAQAVEHYEITRYGTLATWATALGYDDAVPLLRETLSEETATDDKLSHLAETALNERAIA